jgi:hypothetical protein
MSLVLKMNVELHAIEAPKSNLEFLSCDVT